MLRFLAIFALVGCSGQSAPTDGSKLIETTHDHAGHDHAKDDDHDHAKPSETDAKPDAMPKPELASAAKVFFVSPKDGDTVKSPVKIEFGIEGAEVKPAGEDVPNSGHHHLIINGSGINHGDVVPNDEKHIHYGKGQTSTEVELAPGSYTLTMQFANYLHQSYGAQGATSIQITVSE